MRHTMTCGFLVLGALLIAARPAASQDSRFAVMGGLTVATQQTADSAGSVDLTSRTGFEAGGLVRLPILSSIDLQVEGMYVTKGARLLAGGVNNTLALDYVELPVLARLRFGGRRLRPFVLGGIAPAVRTRARAVTSFSGSTESIDVSSEVERIDLGVSAGGGLDAGALILEARYTFGLRDIDKADASRTKNRALAVTAGLRF